jgi:hypothetical protein
MQPPTYRTVLVYGLDDALTAVEAARTQGVPLVLASISGAGGNVGASWFAALANKVTLISGIEVIAVLDCAAEPGWVLAALRAGIRQIRFTGNGQVTHRLQEIARAYSATLWTNEINYLDLRGQPDPLQACQAWLAGSGCNNNRLE